MSKTLYTGSSQVTFTVEVAFTTTNPLSATPTWTDISEYVRDVTITRGRWTETTNQYDPGTCTVTLKNSSRIFDPLYTAGTYYGQLLPMKQIRVRAAYSSTTYDLFRGFVNGWPQGWDPHVPKYSETTIRCTDAFGWLATQPLLDRYANEVLADSPAGFWRCGDPGSELADTSKNGRHGSWGSRAVRSADVALVASDGGSRYMQTPGVNLGTFVDIPADWYPVAGKYQDPSTLYFLGSTTDISLECWLYFQDLEPGTSGVVVVGDVDYYAPGAEPSLSVLIDQDGVSPVILTVSARSDTGADLKTYYVNAPMGQWIHLVATYVKNGALTVYMNGKVVASGSTGRESAFYTLAPQAGFWIQNSDETAVETTGFFIDEVALYPSALSATRVAVHHVAGRTGSKLERSGERIAAVLDHVGWPSGLRTLSSGDSWLDYGPAGEGGALDYLQAVNATEQGRLFIAGDGTVTFQDRTYPIETTAQNTSQATFGDSGTDLRYQRLVLDGGDIESIRNSVVVTPQTGVAGTSEDATSITAYGRRQEPLTSLHANQGDAKNLAAWRLRQFKDPSLNFTELEVHPRRDPANLFPQVLGRSFGDRITVKRLPQGVGSAISQERVIDGIEHVITTDEWTTRWYLTEPTDTYQAAGWWRVGDATYGVVGTARLPY